VNRAQLIEELRRDEGVKLKLYKCTAGKWSIGCADMGGENANDWPQNDKIETKDGAIAARRPSNHPPDYEGVTAMAVFNSDASEVWRPISGFENYEISDHGRVRQLGREFVRQNPYGAHFLPQRIKIKPKMLGGWVRFQNGRPVTVFVSLRRDGETHTFRVHRLVLEAFIGPAPEGTEGCHNNGDPTDNRLANLRWDTHAENVRDSVWHGTKSTPPVRYGEAHHRVTVSDAELAEYRAIPYRHGLYAIFARKWGIANASARKLYKRESRA